jgi:hypothetical protein
VSVGSSDGVNVQVVLKDILEHGSRLASLDVDNHFFVHLVLVHELKGFMELIGVKIPTSWHSNETWGTVVGKVEEDLGVLVGLEFWSLGSGGITLTALDDVGSGGLSRPTRTPRSSSTLPTTVPQVSLLCQLVGIFTPISSMKPLSS